MVDADELLVSAGGSPEQWPQILEELRKQPEQAYRIEIAADSLVAIDEESERQSKIQVVQAFGTLLGQLTPIIEQFPIIAPYGIELMNFVLRSYKKGKDIEGQRRENFTSRSRSRAGEATAAAASTADTWNNRGPIEATGCSDQCTKRSSEDAVRAI